MGCVCAFIFHPLRRSEFPFSPCREGCKGLIFVNFRGKQGDLDRWKENLVLSVVALILNDAVWKKLEFCGGFLKKN